MTGCKIPLSCGNKKLWSVESSHYTKMTGRKRLKEEEDNHDTEIYHKTIMTKELMIVKEVVGFFRQLERKKKESSGL